MLGSSNSFDLWQKDAFFSAAEEVQQSADIMESMYRMWVRGRREIEYSHQLRRDLQISLGTAKWQLDEFDKAVRFTHGYNNSQDNTAARHKQFVDIIDKQISFVEKQLRDSLAEEKQTLSWVHLDEEETDALEAFLSGTSATSQTTDDDIDLESSKSSSFSGDHIRRKDTDNLDTFDCSTKSYKQVVTINRDTKYVVELEAKQAPRNCDDQTDKLAGQMKMWTAPNFGSWKIVIADEDEQNKTLGTYSESSSKGKTYGSRIRKQKGDEHLQTRGRISNFLHLRGFDRYTKLLYKRFSGVQRHLQGGRSIQFSRVLLVILVLVLTIFLIGKLFNISA
ncbi:hypothetical protein ACHQM5_030695 [Ranunculus cassubicifolius]